MGIARAHRKRHNFSIIDNSGATDEDLSWKARGLLWYLLTKPDNWTVRISDLIARSKKDGRDSVKAGFKELEESGYAIRWKERNAQGQFEWITEVFETKEDAQEWKNNHSGKSVDGLPVDGKPGDIVMTHSGITELGITDSSKKSSKKSSKDFRNENGSHFQDGSDKGENPIRVDSFKSKEETPSKGANQSGSIQFGLEQPGSDKFPVVNQEPPHPPSSARPPSPPENAIRAKRSQKGSRPTAYRYDEYGMLCIPKSGLPGILTMRTMQFFVTAKWLEFEFAIDKDQTIWVHDPYSYEWETEEDVFNDVNRMPLKKAIAIANDSGALDVDEYNEAVVKYYEYYKGQCKKLGSRASQAFQKKSIALWIDGLVELQDLDDVAV